MRLYKDRDLLNRAVAATARCYKADPSIVERDYYVTVFLKRLTKSLPDLVLAGSAPLFTCHKAIKRLPGDLDLTLAQDPVPKSQRKQVKRAITESCSDLGFVLLNADAVRSSRDRCCYEIDYSPKKPSAAPRSVFLVKIDYTVKASPFETMPATSMICDCMRAAGREDFIRQYKLEPFPVSVQTTDRALIDMIFALCDSYLDGRITGQAHYLYDISRLAERVSPDDDWISLFQAVRADRKADAARYPSASDRYNIPDLFAKILEQDIYKSDYRDITSRTLFGETAYEEAAAGVRKLIGDALPDSGRNQPFS